VTARTRSIVTASIAAAIGLAILLSLGTWQVQRMTWKQTLIATLDARIDQPPQALPPRTTWASLTQADSEYARVKFTATLLPGEAFVYTAGSSLRSDITGQGYWVFAPARLDDGATVLVNRGFVPTDRKAPATRVAGAPGAPLEIVGYLRWPESRGMFAPTDDVKANVFFTRDPKTMAAANGWTIDAPFYVDQELPVPAGGLPKPGRIEVKLPNNHWQYAITWYGLALALIGVYGAWLAGRLRRRPAP